MFSNLQAAPEAVAEYLDQGYDAIPLRPGAKIPAFSRWQYTSPAAQWAQTPNPDRCNIGLRAGGAQQAVFIDCDDKEDPQTSANVKRILAGMGLMPDGDYPFVATASGKGGHVYARLSVPLEGHYKRLRGDLGTGELRYGPASMVVAPGSIVDGRTYQLLVGGLDQVPVLDLGDARLFADVEPASSSTKKRKIPRKAYDLIRGKPHQYPTNSEAEQYIIVALIGAGYDFDDILSVFQRHPCAGKFASLRAVSERNAIRWLRLSYSNARRWSEGHESEGRKLGREVQRWVLSRPWPGVTGNSDMVVILAHAEICKLAGALVYAAPIRRLAELAGVAYLTAQRANVRLLNAGLVQLERSHVGTLGALYRLTGAQTYITSTQGDCEEVIHLCADTTDAFEYMGLGKSALLVWQYLRQSPGMTRAELVRATGKSRDTVRRALARMSCLVDEASGEVLRLVEPDGERWHALEPELETVARVVGTAGAGQRRKDKHAKDRANFQRAVARA